MMEKRIALAGSLFVVLLAGLALLGNLVWWRSSDAEWPGTANDIPLAPDKSLGINADLTHYDESSLGSMLEAMETGGMRWLRQRVAWSEVEARPGEYEWAAYDSVLAAARSHNLKVIAVLDGSPEWARAAEDAGEALAPPARFEAFGAFAGAFAARYGAWVDHYQIWDEPNIAPHWGNREVSPEGYAKLLREAAIQIRTIDPGAVIVAAALAPNVEPGGDNMSDLKYLDELYHAGAAEWFDVVAVQPYDFGESLDAEARAEVLSWRRASLVREVMLSHGDGGTAVWAVSFGVQDNLYSGTEGGLAVILQPLVASAWDEWPWMGPMLWAAWSTDDAHGEYALTADGVLDRAVADAFAEITSVQDAVAWPGAHRADHTSGRYEGEWRVTSLGADIGATGDRLTIRFRGSGLELRVRRGDYRGFLWVTVDGQPANELPRDRNGRAYAVLYDPLHQEASVAVAGGLPHAEHEAVIEAERGWGQWALLGWTVLNEPEARSFWPVGLLGVIAAVAVCTGAWATSRPTTRRRIGLGLLTLDRHLGRVRTVDTSISLGLVVFAAALTYAVGGGVPSLLGIAVLFVALCLWPGLGLTVIALALPFYQLGVPLAGKVFSMVEILVLLTMAGWLMNILAVRGVQLRGTKRTLPNLTWIDAGIGLLLGVAVISLVGAEHTRVALREFRTVILEAALFYGLLRVLVQSPRGAWRVVDGWVLGATAIATVGIVQWTLGSNVIATDGVWRVRGFYGSPNNLALYLGRTLPMGVAVALWATNRSRRMWYALATALMAAAIGLSYSRGALLLGVPATLAFVLVFRPQRGRHRSVIAVVAVVAILSVVLLIGTERLDSALDFTRGTMSFRKQLWRSSWMMAMDHPLQGVGLDSFLYYYRTEYVLPTAWEELDLSHPHNFVLDFWLRLGLAGLAALLLTLGAFLRTGWIALKAATHDLDSVLILGLMAGVISFVVHGLVDNAFFLVDLAFAFMLACALVQTGLGAGGQSNANRAGE